MNERDKIPDSDQPAESNHAGSQPESEVVAAEETRQRKDARRWWIKLFIQPLLLLVCGATLVVGLGIAQRLGFISSNGGEQGQVSAGGPKTRYICPMMCTPPQSEPGRCPVCAMELVKATSGGGDSDTRSIQIDAASRRIANIRTVAVRATPMTRAIRAIGDINYNEATLKTISAYVDGRLDRLYADYTGVVVEKGDHLALVYSPALYSGQVELLLARKARNDSSPAALRSVTKFNRDLYASARQRLIELGMTQAQIQQVEQSGEASSRMHLCAPISGTVIEKHAVEGEYVKEGQAIYKLADLSAVWLMLKLFPEDAAVIRDGHEVAAEVRSLPGQQFSGRVEFIDPHVDPRTRTVGVRVAISNEDGVLRVGDYAKATIEVPLAHPTAKPSDSGDCLVVPRDAVLMAGNNSVLYVESEPGRFEIRRIVLGPACGHEIVILSGVEEGEQVATRGNFLIDSQMQLAGNPSLIDPTKAEPIIEIEFNDEDLPPIDTPQLVIAEVSSQQADNQSEPGKNEKAEIAAALAKLSPDDRALAEKQRFCPVADFRLGSMGTPKKVDLNGKPVFICCEGCRDSLTQQPDKYLAKLAAATSMDTHKSDPDTNLPPIGRPEAIEAPTDAPGTQVPRALPKRPAKRVADLPMETVR